MLSSSMLKDCVSSVATPRGMNIIDWSPHMIFIDIPSKIADAPPSAVALTSKL